MSVEKSQSHEVDLDRTDRLPILEGALFEAHADANVEDDAVQIEYAPVPSAKSDFPRPNGMDLPSLAETVRSVEERIARQQSEYEALSRSYEKARDAEIAAVARTHALTVELTGMRATLEAEHNRSREIQAGLAEKSAAAEAARARMEETLRESERFQSESRTLRDTLAAREANLAQALHSLGERDAQLSQLQREHAKVVPALEERSKASKQLEGELRAVKSRSDSVTVDLKKTRLAAVALTAQIKSGDEELNVTRRDLDVMKTQVAAHLEQLRTREWRRGFDHNMFRELDAEIGAVQENRAHLKSERDQLRQRLADIEAKLAAREATIAKLNAAATKDEALRATHELKVREMDKARADLAEQIARLEGEKGRLNGELAAREESIARLHATVAAGETQRVEQDLRIQHAETARADLGAQIAALEGERTRLNGELAARDQVISKLNTAAAEGDVLRAKQEFKLQKTDAVRAELNAQIAALEGERNRLNGELTLRERVIADSRVAVTGETQRAKDLLSEAEKTHRELATKVEQLTLEAQTREDEMDVLMAHLQEARRPLEPIEEDVRRLTDELAAKAVSLEQLNEDNRSLRAALERTRGALEEREFLIRRLERSESNNANILGRLQTSIERLGVPNGSGTATQSAVECVAELVRIGGQQNTSHTLGRRTRIGRAAGCELQIDSSSVSRHHALVLMGARDVIIEDLNSTNGVLVNGRKVTRHLLTDGDTVMIGDVQFRLSLNFAPRILESAVAPPAAAPTESQ